MMTTFPVRLTIRVPLRVGLSYAALAIASVASTFPILWLLITSFKSRRELFVVPPHLWPYNPTLENYRDLVSSDPQVISLPVMQAFANTIVVSTVATFVALVVGTCAAYSFAHYRFPGARFIFFGVLITRMFPVIMLAIPLFRLIGQLGLRDTRLGLIIAYTALCLPFVIWMMHAFFSSIPKELAEAAQVDGCSPFAAFRRVILPLAAPGLAATAILTIIYPWNDLLLAVILTSSPQSQTVSVTLAQFVTEFQVSWGPLTAASMLFSLPILIGSLFVQRYLVQGMTLGAIKG